MVIALVMIHHATIGNAGERPAEIDSHEAAFNTMLHDGVELYLVCITNADKKPWHGEREQLFIKATIVNVIRGTKQIGDKIEFKRVLDGKYGDVPALHGSLYFVRYDVVDETKTSSINPQDPQALFSYTADFHAQAIEHKGEEENPRMETPRKPSD